MPNSILDTTKKMLGFDPDYTAFDTDIILHVNSVFSTLQQLGIGPIAGFSIEDKQPEWPAFTLGNPKMNAVKSYMYLRVRLLFDPPATSFAMESMAKQAQEIEWRLMIDFDPKIIYLPEGDIE